MGFQGPKIQNRGAFQGEFQSKFKVMHLKVNLLLKLIPIETFGQEQYYQHLNHKACQIRMCRPTMKQEP